MKKITPAYDYLPHQRELEKEAFGRNNGREGVSGTEPNQNMFG